MIKQISQRVKPEKAKSKITDNTAIIGLLGELRRNRLIEYFDRALPPRVSNRSYKPSNHALTYLFTRLSGGYNLEDTLEVSTDKEVHKLLEIGGMPSPNTLGDWFRDAEGQHSKNVRTKNMHLCNRIIKKKKKKELAVDIDSKVHESDNEEAKMTYEDTKGYNPLYILLPEMKLVYDGEFRQGDTTAGEGNEEALRRVVKKAPENVETLRFRLDSAGWQKDVLKAARENNKGEDKSCEIFVRPGNHGKKDGLGDVEREIRAIPEKQWEGYGEYKGEETQWEIAETVKTIGSGKDMEVFRMVVVREPEQEEGKQKRLFDGVYNYSCVVTNNETFSGQEVHEFYNQRGSAEDLIGEIVEDGRCERFPMKADNANSLWLVLGVMLHTLVQMMKLRNLPEKWYKLTMKTVRHRLMNVAVRIVETGRYIYLRIKGSHPWIEELKAFITRSWYPLNKLTAD